MQVCVCCFGDGNIRGGCNEDFKVGGGLLGQEEVGDDV